jgi:hypothetical protein
MTISADLDELRRLEAVASEYGGSDLSTLQTIEELYAWLIATARADGADEGGEGDTVETFARFSGATAPEVRAIAATLRQLGYATAADRLREIAGKRRRDLRPLT